MSTPLEAWRAALGDTYTERHGVSPATLDSRMAMWGRLLGLMDGDTPESILEVGANIGLNLRALRLLTGAKLAAVEPNDGARERLVLDGVVTYDNAHGVSASDLPRDVGFDLVFTCGLLIHIPPDDLGKVCAEIYRVSNKYILCIEYFADRPEELPYRGHEGLLWKRDFGDFWMARYPNLALVDYGFLWRRATGLDNLTYWLFRKANHASV